MTGALIAVVGPSGAGKDTLIAAAVAARPEIVWARRAITRPEAAESEPFEAVTRTEFARRRDAGELALWWEAHGLYYGLPASIADDLAAGRTVILNCSRAALADARARWPDVRIVLVTAPREMLAARLAARGRETAAEISARLARAAPDMPENATVVLNDGSVEAGAARLLNAISRRAAPAG